MAEKLRIAPQVLVAILVATSISSLSTPASAANTTSARKEPGPKIISPAERVVIPHDLKITVEGGPGNRVTTEVEMWRVSSGQLAHKVWQAKLDSGDLTDVTLDAGRFEAGVESLIPWKRYALRARHGTSSGFTDWGPKRIFLTDDGSEEVFKPGVIGEVWLDIPESSWTPIDDEALTACEFHPRSYYPGTIRIGDIDYPGSGLRVKGGCGSSRRLKDKAAFKANMSWDDPAVDGCPLTRRYEGLKKLTFNNQVQDASFTHERIGYDFLRKLGIPVPRVAPIRLHVNGQLWGLYLHVETLDRRFLSRRFASNDGMLYEAGYGCDIGEESCFEEKFDTDACDEPRAGDVTNIFPLRNLHGRLGQLPNDNIYPRINQIIDFEAYLTVWAAASIMGYFDGYPFDPNNYRLYHDPSNDRWTLLPTGIDQIFEQDVDPFNPVGMLSIRCLAEEDCKAAFRRKLAKALDVFEASDYPVMARAIERQIRAEVEADPRKKISVAEWQAAVNETVQYIQRRPGELRDLLARTEQETSKTAGRHFSFHALTDPRGDRFVSVSWAFPGNESSPGQQWIAAKGYFDMLEANMDAFQLKGGSAGGIRVGTVSVSYLDCQTAKFVFTPDGTILPNQNTTAPIDSSIWKYCG
jgi:hypothetical protein